MNSPLFKVQIAQVAFFIIVAIATFMPEARLWGVNHLAYYPLWLRLLALAVMGVSFVPRVSAQLDNAIAGVIAGITRNKTIPALPIVTAIGALILFLLLRVRALLLGDSSFLALNYGVAFKNGFAITDYFNVVTTTQNIYPGADLINYIAYSAAARLGASSPDIGIAVLASLIGAVIVYASVKLALRHHSVAATIALLLFVTSGVVQLMFGYVENYIAGLTLGGAAVVMMLWSKRVSPLWVVLAVFAAIMCHVQMALLLPATLLWFIGRSTQQRSLLVDIVVAVVTIGGVGLFWWLDRTRTYFLNSEELLSLSHGVDIFNLVLLLCPALLVGIAAMSRDSKDDYRGSIMIALILPAAFFVACFRPALGMARDWDLYAVTGIAVLVLVARSLVRFISNNAVNRQTLMPTLVTSLILTAAWVGINASAPRAEARYLSILSYDLTTPGYTFEILADHYGRTGNVPARIQTLERAYDASPNPRYLLKIGRTYYDAGHMEPAAHFFDLSLAANPDDHKLRILLLHVLDSMQAHETMIDVARGGILRGPQVPDFHFFLGRALIGTGETQEGLKSLRTCSTLNPDPNQLREINRMFQDDARQPSSEDSTEQN